MKQQEITTEQSYNIVKSNDLIQRSRFDLNVTEQKIILRLIQLICPDDTTLKTYTINIQDFCDMCGIDRNNGKNYINIKRTIQALADKSFWVLLPDGKEALCRWISKARIVSKSGTIELKLDDDLAPYLLQLKKNFTAYSLYNVMGMKSKYSPRLYELIKSHEFQNTFVIGIEELKRMLCAEKYQYCNFRQKVLDVSVKEINDTSDIVVSYETIKSGRKVESIRFRVRIKNTDESLATVLARNNNNTDCTTECEISE